MEILSISSDIAPGSKDKKIVTVIQEWLNLNDELIRVDGDYGPATENAVASFQRRSGLPQTGIVNPFTFSLLVSPLVSATGTVLTASEPLPEACLKVASFHADQHPREVGGNNRGPWVRHYMDGKQGEDYPWCAGFITTCLLQAAAEMHVNAPFEKTFSCDVLANWAKTKGKFVSGNSDLSSVRPGHFFLVRKTATDWTHTGIVTEVGDGFVKTVEGNTNDDGSREGYEVCRRTRGVKNLDFVTY